MKRAWITVLCAAAAVFGLPVAASASTTSGNLIVDGDAETGYCTTDWHAATTMPGWTVTQNSPDVICYSAGSFSHPGSPAPGKALFAPGDQGDATMTQTVDVSSAGTAIDGGNVTFALSGWLGGWTSYAGTVSVSLSFFNGSSGQLGGGVTLPTVTAADRGNQTGLLARSTTGAVPSGTRSILVKVQFLNSSGESGYLDNLSLTLSTPVTTPVLTPPPSAVPGYDHVFMIMMENTNYADIVADTSGMPYYHGLMAQGTSFANYHAVYHPSDENYLAISGGDTFATGAVYWPNIKDPGQHIGDELEAKSSSWKAYEQGMGTPCNTTKPFADQYYAPDDAPFIHYNNVAGNSARCQAHLVDTTQLSTDLASTATTPAFSWIAADDYYDGESAGNGNAQSRKVQDGWLKQTIDPILASPAWTTQKSLLLVTWDENLGGSDNQVATVAVGSKGTVRAGYTSNTRYDHYSTGRTIENALGLAPITSNDAYAAPLNDAFGSGATSAVTTPNSSVPNGSRFTVNHSTQPSTVSSTNWVGIYHAGNTPGQQSSVTWQYAPNPSGSLSFDTASLSGPGSYTIWYCYNNGYTVLAGPTPLTVS